MKKITLIITVFLVLALGNATAGTDGENSLSKNKNGEVKDCFEGLNRAFFAFNKGLDNILVEPTLQSFEASSQFALDNS